MIPTTQTAVRKLLDLIKIVHLDHRAKTVKVKLDGEISVDEYRALLKASGGEVEWPLRGFRDDE